MRLITPNDAAPAAAGILYAEDFDDLPRPAPPPAPPAPLFDAASLQAARAAGFEDGLAEGAARAAASAEAETVATLGRVAASLDDLGAAAAAAAEACADATAGLLLACLRRVLPELCRRHGEAEAAAVARAILPGLRQEASITVRAAPATAAAVAAVFARHDDELAGRLRVVPTDAFAPGDVRIAWAEGDVTRDVAAIWRAIAETLSASGVALPPDIAPDATADGPAAAPTPSRYSVKDLHHAD